MMEDLWSAAERQRAEPHHPFGEIDGGASLVAEFVRTAVTHGLPTKPIILIRHTVTLILRDLEPRIIGETRGWGPFTMSDNSYLAIDEQGRAIDAWTDIPGNDRTSQKLTRHIRSGGIVAEPDKAPNISPWLRGALTSYLAAHPRP